MREVVSTSEENELVSAPEANAVTSKSEVNQFVSTSETEQSLVTSKNAEEGTISLEKTSSVEPPETNSCDSKVGSLTIDSGSCSDYTQRGAEGTLSQSAIESVAKEKEIESDRNDAATMINLNKEAEYQHQTSPSTTETEDVHCNTSAPENFSTLTATNQSDEIVSEPVIDQLTPDVTSISTPSFDDQDNQTNDSILNDRTESIETPADISIKEIGKFQIFNRKVEDDRSKRIFEQNVQVSNCPPKLQYDDSEEAKTPLVLTQPTISEVPLTGNVPMSTIDLKKELKSHESSGSIQQTIDVPELAKPLQTQSVEMANSNQDPLMQFPISFKNTQINNRKRPLASKNDFVDTDESSSESSEEEVEVKRQKTKPKFSHLAARKNAEIKRKATQIDCSTDEDEPVNKVQLKTISTELSKIENAVKQKKIMNEKTPIKISKEPATTSAQNIRSATAKLPVQNEAVFSKGNLESVCIVAPATTFESKSIPVMESATNLVMVEKGESANIKDVNEAPSAIVNTNLPKTLTELFVDKKQVDAKPKVEIKSHEIELQEKNIGEKLKDELKEEVMSLEEIKSNEEIKLTESMKSKNDLEPKQEVKPEVELKTIQDIRSKYERKSNDDENDSKADTQTTQNVKTTKEEIEVQTATEVKLKQKIEEKVEVISKEKTQTKNEKHDVPQGVKKISESETEKVETQPSKPGPKSKKPGFVPVQAGSIVNAEITVSAEGKLYFHYPKF